MPVTILGQEKILNKINRSTLDTLPHSLILCGEQGSGKHTLAQYISSKFDLKLIDITHSLTLEFFEELNLRVEPYVYLIDGSVITAKEENVILKFLEEPLKNAFMIILCTYRTQLLPTVLNRCQIWELQQYSRDILVTFIKIQTFSDVMLAVGDTPGKLLLLQSHSNIESMSMLADKIFTSIKFANPANILTLSNKIAFNNEVEKFDFNLFVDVLVFIIKQKITTTTDPILVDVYKLTNKLSNERYIPHINTRILFENYLFELKDLMKII